MTKQRDHKNESIEQRKKERASQHKRLGPIEDKKLNGPNRPST